jgi:DNA-binding transcriptional LysR family regulator
MVTFIAVVDTNDVRNASRILKMDLSAVIDALHELECYFGIKLVSVYGMRELYTPSGRLRKLHKPN